jgi:diacylglycerol kinase family enzyme
VLGQVRLDLAEPRADPVLQPGVGQVVRDAVQTALAHGGNHRHRIGRLPWAERLNFRDRRTYHYPPGRVGGFLLVNPRSGDDRPTADELAREAERRGVTVHVLASGDDAAELARSADATALGIAGGDGSLADVAAVAVERGLPFVCVPFGTRNHFARDLGLDRDDPVAALDAFVDGVERPVDVGRVDGRVFLNNVSLGLYARLVHRREGHRRRREALAGARALWLVARHRHPLRVTIDGERVAARILLVASNDYELSLFSLGERPSLTDGELHLYTARGWVPREWKERSAAAFTLDAADARLPGALDGEPVVLEPPVRFEIEPRALRVLVPKER